MFTEYSEYPGQQVGGYDNQEDFASKTKARVSTSKPSTASKPTTGSGSTTIVQTTTRTGGGGYGYGYGYGVPIIATTPVITTSPSGTVVYTRSSSMYGWIFAVIFIVAIIALVYYFGDFDGDDTVTTTTIIRNSGGSVSRGLSKLSKSARYLRK
jgi:hypothetical protein